MWASTDLSLFKSRYYTETLGMSGLQLYCVSACRSLSAGTLQEMTHDVPHSLGMYKRDPHGMQAFTWTGFEDGTTFLGGLWNDSTTLGGDFATVVYRAQLLGFNAVRLPFRFSDLNLQPKNWTFPCIPQRFADIRVIHQPYILVNTPMP